MTERQALGPGSVLGSRGWLEEGLAFTLSRAAKYNDPKWPRTLNEQDKEL